jgi:hypothetical protein
MQSVDDLLRKNLGAFGGHIRDNGVNLFKNSTPRTI